MSGYGGSSSDGKPSDGFVFHDEDYAFTPDKDTTTDFIEKDETIKRNDDKSGEKTDEQIKAGQLSAKALFDNEQDRYYYFSSLLSKDSQYIGEFYNYYKDFKLDYKRVKVTVKNAPYAKVSLLDKDNKELWEATADINGECYLFSNATGSKVRVTVDNQTKTYDVEKNLEINDFTVETTKHDKVQVLFNIDTTGSMGDEIKYLKAELADVITKIEDGTNADVEVGFIAYRDKDDDYLINSFDFSEDIDSALSFSNKQFAAGGGDFPEAVEQSYDRAKQFNWKNDATKIIVHVADAPSHDADVKSWFQSVKDFAEMGTRILTVASSGIDKKTEYFFRMQSLQTNGCYAYLTNDSGIGADHIEASVLEEVPTEYLNDLLVRVIKGFHNGEYDEPEAFNISELPELIELNKNIGISKGIQALFARRYIEQFGAGKEGAKASLAYAYVYKDIPFVYMNDNFLEIDKKPSSEKIYDYTFKYPDSTKKIMVFDGSKFITMQKACDFEIINSIYVSKLYENVINSPIFKDLYTAK